MKKYTNAVKKGALKLKNLSRKNRNKCIASILILFYLGLKILQVKKVIK